MVTDDDFPALFSVSSRREGTWRIVEVTGEIDLATAPRLQDHLIESISADDPPPGLILDMTKVEFCDACGLRVLVGAHQWINRHGGRLRLICPEGQLLRILRITKLTRLLRVHPTLDEALDHDPPRNPGDRTGRCTHAAPPR